MESPQLGHVYLKVRDLDRATAYYTRVLGLRVQDRVGSRYVFLTGGQEHHELALQEVGPDASTPGRDAVGLFHVAIRVADRPSLARALKRIHGAGLGAHAVDHGISQALYLEDPDGNGREIYLDTRRRAENRSRWRGRSAPLDEKKILSEIG